MSNQWIDYLVQRNGLIECRGLTAKGRNDRSAYRWFRDASKAQSFLQSLSDRHLNAYTTLHRVETCPHNRMAWDTDVTHYNALFIDIDAKQSTPESAMQAAHSIVDQLADRYGFPREPIIGSSGGGAHIHYEYEKQLEAKAMKPILNDWYRFLDGSLDLPPEVDFDRSVRSAGQICRAYGFDNLNYSDPRPATVEMPSTIEPLRSKAMNALHSDVKEMVKAEEVEREAARQAAAERNRQWKEANPGQGRLSAETIDIVAWFQQMGLYRHHVRDNMHAVTCPYSAEHGGAKGGTVIYEAQIGNWPGMHCHHSSCQGRKFTQLLKDFPSWKQFAREIG